MGQYASFLLIEEINVTGRGARSLFLSGNGLPHQGASWKGANTVPTTWYPGNPRATQQLLTTKEIPSSWEGEWKRTLLPRSGSHFTDVDGSQTSIVSPWQLRDYFEMLLREGALLRVTWRSTGPDTWDNDSVVREGRATQWEFPTTRAHDIGWSVEFTWVGRGEKRTPPISTRDANYTAKLAALDASMSVWAASVATTTAIANGNPLAARAASIGSANPLTLGQLESMADYPTKVLTAASRSVQVVTSQMKTLSSIAQKIASVPAQVQNGAISMAMNVSRGVDDFIDSMGQIPAELLSKKQEPAAVLAAHRYFGGTVDAARATNENAVSLAGALRAFISERAALRAQVSSQSVSGQRQGDILAIHVAREGDTLIGLSMQYYDSPDNAADIARANRLPWYVASPVVGQPIIIPIVQTSRPTGA